MTGWKPSPALAGPLYGKDPWPLRFHAFKFGARCWNTQACSIVYGGHEFGSREYHYGQYLDKPSGPRPPKMDHWVGSWSNGEYAPIAPVALEWTAMDGSKHQATVDLEKIFKDRLVLHRLSKEEIPEGWLASCSVAPVSPSLLVEINDRTVNVYMNAMVTTTAEQIPGNPNSHARHDLILAWTHTY